jgi:hypothetical protein
MIDRETYWASITGTNAMRRCHFGEKWTNANSIQFGPDSYKNLDTSGRAALGFADDKIVGAT